MKIDLSTTSIQSESAIRNRITDKLAHHKISSLKVIVDSSYRAVAHSNPSVDAIDRLLSKSVSARRILEDSGVPGSSILDIYQDLRIESRKQVGEGVDFPDTPHENQDFSSMPTHIGHRRRMKEKFLIVEPSSFTDYELIELLLFQSIPRKDVKPIAKELLRKFGSISRVVKASHEEVLTVTGTNENISISLKLIKEMMRRSLKQDILNKNAISSWSMLVEYLTFTMGALDVEEFHVLFLNNKNHLIEDELMARGTINQTPVYPREIVKKALHYSATSLILVHNHPSGNSQPSNADIDITTEIVNACKSVNVKVHDHVIIGTEGYYSFKSNLLL